MAKQSPDEKRRKGLENLGHAVIALVMDLPNPENITYEDEFQLGLTIRKMMKAGIKATIEGDQRDRQVTEELDAAVKAANRLLARRIKQV